MTIKHSFSACLHPGCVVEFMHGDKPQPAWVLEEQSGRLRLLTITRREAKLPVARIMAWTGPHYAGEHTREQILEALATHQSKRDALAEQINPMDIWELAQGEVEQAKLEWLAELVWEKETAADPEHLAAMGRALLGCKTHFKYQPPDFIVFSEEKVQAKLEAQRQTEERERLSGAGREFFERLWQTRNQEGGPELVVLEDELEHQLRDLLLQRIAEPDDQESEQIWKLVRKGLPEVPHLELQLAQAWGIVPSHHNYHYDQAGYAPGDAWSAAHENDIEALRQRVMSLRQEPEATPFVSVDSATTRDIDDAFYLEQGEDGGYSLRLALARPALGWETDSTLGQEVARRATSIYLPEGDSHMLPETLGTELYSLLEGVARPALIMDIALDADGKLLSCDMLNTWVQVASNTSYVLAEEAITACRQEQEGCTPQGRMLALGAELAEKLRARRVQQGAVVIERQDPDIVLEGEGDNVRVLLEPKAETPASQLLVSELMILANSAASAWAKERGIALLHRTQDIAISKEGAGVWSAPEDIHKVVRSLSSAILEPDPRPHASLGVPAYSPVSSPLRRYPDFLNMLQLQHFLENGEPLYDKSRFVDMLPLLNARLEAASRIQRFRPRYWKLLYLRQQPRETLYPAVVVDEGPHFLMLSMPREQMFVRGPRSLFGDKVFPGQRYMIRLGKIAPLHNEVHVIEAEEDESDESLEAAMMEGGEN